MKFEHLMKWVNALRSGKYKKTEGQLSNKDGYCALGVLHQALKHPLRSYTGNAVCNEYGVSLNFKERLISKNDRIIWDEDNHKGFRQSTFDEVADYIEQNKDDLLGTDFEPTS